MYRQIAAAPRFIPQVAWTPAAPFRIAPAHPRSRYGAGLKEVGARSRSLQTLVTLTSREVESLAAFEERRAEATQRNGRGKRRRREERREGRLNPAKRHMARAPTPTMLAAITTWKKCSTMIGGERARRPRGPRRMISHLSPFCKNSQAEVELANTSDNPGQVWHFIMRRCMIK